MNLYWVTKSGTYHWTLECPALRRAHLGSIVATTQEPPTMRMLCVHCLDAMGRLPLGYDLSSEFPRGTRKWKKIVEAARFDG